jgi:lysylphosphatidylglycerol synthetase-like protein (DUF2156 family)
MKKVTSKIFITLSLLFFTTIPCLVLAASPLSALKDVANTGGYREANQTTLSAIAGSAVSTILGLLGVIFVCLILYAGITWMTAEGDEARVEKAQTILRNAIIGLIITVSVWAIYIFILPLFTSIS